MRNYVSNGIKLALIRILSRYFTITRRLKTYQLSLPCCEPEIQIKLNHNLKLRQCRMAPKHRKNNCQTCKKTVKILTDFWRASAWYMPASSCVFRVFFTELWAFICAVWRIAPICRNSFAHAVRAQYQFSEMNRWISDRFSQRCSSINRRPRRRNSPQRQGRCSE